MRTPVVLLLTATLVLSGCQSRWNPTNWGASKSQSVPEDQNPLIPDKTDTGRSFFTTQKEAEYNGLLIDRVSNVEVHRVTEGRLVMALGVSSVHGTSSIRLIAENGGVPENGVLTLSLMGRPPQEPIAGGSDLTREVTAGTVLTEQQMAGVRTVRVKALRNTIDRRAR